jgi:ABC-type transport system substrate-binding protein
VRLVGDEQRRDGDKHGPGTGTTGTSSGQGPKSGGSVTVIEAGLDSQFDPALAFISTFTDGPEMEALYGPGLVYQNAATGAVEMGFAKSLTASQGNKVWTMVLHDELKFSDGTAFNAQAVVDNINRIADPATGSTERAIASTISAKAVNDTTVQFTLQKPNPQFPSVISQGFALVPSPTAVKKEGSSFASHPVGAGPFMMGTLTPSVSLALGRRVPVRRDRRRVRRPHRHGRRGDRAGRPRARAARVRTRLRARGHREAHRGTTGRRPLAGAAVRLVTGTPG